MVAVASRNIRKGEELEDCYGVSQFSGHSKDWRREALQNRYGFQCSCPACGGEIAGEEEMAEQHRSILGTTWQKDGNKVFGRSGVLFSS